MGFRPLTGISCNLLSIRTKTVRTSFRPLTGISCNPRTHTNSLSRFLRFRPLTGISCNAGLSMWYHSGPCFRPLAGMSCNSMLSVRRVIHSISYRPLAGISCIIQNYYTSFCSKRKGRFQEKRPYYGVRSGKPGGRQNARSAQNPPGGAEGAPAGRVFLVLLWAAYRMRTRMTAGMLLSFSLRRASTTPVASSMV